MSSNCSSTDSIDPALVSSKNIDITKFQRILASLEEVDDKKKALWLEIYVNAKTDRQLAFELYEDVSNTIFNTTETVNHITFGLQATKYLERMAKSNDQLLKLAELIADAEQQSAAVDPNSVLDMLEQNDG